VRCESVVRRVDENARDFKAQFQQNVDQIAFTSKRKLSDMFEIRKLEGKGNGIVATEAIKAGAIIHREQPLMRLTPECLKEYNRVAPKGIDKLLAAMSFFRKQMTPEQQEKYLSLHGGQTTGPHADNLRPLVEMLSVGGKSLSDADKVQNIGVALVMSNNAFGTDDDVLIYETASRSATRANPTVPTPSMDPRSLCRLLSVFRRARSLRWTIIPREDCSPLT
jgi:hypothetical protein